MKYMDEVKEKLMSLDQFKVEFDLEGMRALESRLVEELDRQNEYLAIEAEKAGIEKFTINSSPKKALLLKSWGIDTGGKGDLDSYSYLLGKVPEVGVLFKAVKLEGLRRKIQGSAKKGNSMESNLVKEGDRYTFKPETNMTDGRLYQKVLYSMPMELRQFVKPYKGEEFHYFDLAVAELTMMAYMSKNEKLMHDCTHGFWEKWYKKLGIDSKLKGDLKIAIYSCIYSLSDYSIPRPIGKKFYNMFFREYSGLEEWLNDRMKSVERVKYNTSWGGQVHTYDLGEKKWGFKALNHPIQKGLANYVLALALELSPFCYIASINFDSVLVSGIDKDDLENLILKKMAKLGINFGFKMGSGSNYREAQERA